MTSLTQDHLEELSSDSLARTTVSVRRGDSVQTFVLFGMRGRGMTGVVWRGKDDLGIDVALKFIPASEYSEHSLFDEASEASKVESPHFARVLFFGDVSLQMQLLHGPYKCIVTEWVEGIPIRDFGSQSILSVSEFLILAGQLFSALASLGNRFLVHDDLHPDNILVTNLIDPLTGDKTVSLKIVDTGTIKRCTTRQRLLAELRERLAQLRKIAPTDPETHRLEQRLKWKEPDDHLRVVDSLICLANGLEARYSQLKLWERVFLDQLHQSFFQQLVDSDPQRRLDRPREVVQTLKRLEHQSKSADAGTPRQLVSPFDYISAEMIRDDAEFAELFSMECPWLGDCRALQPLYIYGPRGCGKSTVLRWLSFKVAAADPRGNRLNNLTEIGVYVSCSVELRSRFWLFDKATIDKLQTPIIRYFGLLLIEELFDTLLVMWQFESSGRCDFGLRAADLSSFTAWVCKRLLPDETPPVRLEGQDYFTYLRGLTRELRWETWSLIQRGVSTPGRPPDPAMVADICRGLAESFEFFQARHVVFLVDDYSNQRIPAVLQRKLNQTISFAKQGTPIFKVSAEYNGVDLEGIQEGREAQEVNIGRVYTAPAGGSRNGDPAFLRDILNRRLERAGYKSRIDDILGDKYPLDKTMSEAIVAEADGTGPPFYYAGLATVHSLCSGDVALALDLVRRIFEDNGVNTDTQQKVAPAAQHRTIQAYSNDEIRRLRYVVPLGQRMHDIVTSLGGLARAILINKKSSRLDKRGDPVCKTHLDIAAHALSELVSESPALYRVFEEITSRAVLFSLETSRSRLQDRTERLQLRRIFFAAFKAAVKRDEPIRIDTCDALISLLSDPRAFAERELKKADVDPDQLELAFDSANLTPRD